VTQPNFACLPEDLRMLPRQYTSLTLWQASLWNSIDKTNAPSSSYEYAIHAARHGDPISADLLREFQVRCVKYKLSK